MAESGISKKIVDNKSIWLLFGVCWVAYFISYVGRINYSAAMPYIIGGGSLSMTQAGSLSTAFFLCYGGGQLINGMLGDRFKPERLVFIGLGLSAVANFLMGVGFGYAFVLIFWAINGYVLSMLWPPIIRIFADMLEERTMVRCCVHITSSMAAGSLCAYLLASLVIRFWGWQAVFFMAAVMLLCMCAAWWAVFSVIKKRRDLLGVTPAPKPEKSSDAKSRGGGFIRYLFGSGILIFLLPVIIHGAMKDGITAWVPTMLAQTFDVPGSMAVLATAVLPLANLSGAYMAGWAFKRWIKNEILCAAAFFAMALASLVAILLVGSVNILLTVSLLAVITASMLAINVLMINFVPLRFHGMGRTATVSGMFNATAYIGSAVTTAGIGWVVSGFGWDMAMVTFAVITVFAIAMCLFGGRVKLPSLGEK